MGDVQTEHFRAILNAWKQELVDDIEPLRRNEQYKVLEKLNINSTSNAHLESHI